MFCQNDKSEKNINLTESNKQGSSKNTFQRIEDLCKLQKAGFPWCKLGHILWEWWDICGFLHSQSR